MCFVTAGAGGGGNDMQWCFSQVKGAIDDDVAEGECCLFFFIIFYIKKCKYGFVQIHKPEVILNLLLIVFTCTHVVCFLITWKVTPSHLHLVKPPKLHKR